MSASYIYGLRDPNTGRICYVGRTKNLKERYAYHIYQSHSQPLQSWIRALRQAGSRPELIILEEISGFHSSTAQQEIQWMIQLAEEGHPILNQVDMPTHLRYPRRKLRRNALATADARHQALYGELKPPDRAITEGE
jgi:hypothetical protein